MTSQIPPIKITVVGLPLRGFGMHDEGKNPVNDHGSSNGEASGKIMAFRPQEWADWALWLGFRRSGTASGSGLRQGNERGVLRLKDVSIKMGVGLR